MKFNYFYKITNNLNGHFYYGVHRTSNLNDNYMGSGKALHQAYKKYGKENFTKEIIKYFDTYDEALKYEAHIVNEDMIKNKMCYNLVVGGGNTKEVQISRNKFSIRTTDFKKLFHEYWSTGDIQAKKKKISDASRRYWSTGDIEAKRKLRSDQLKKAYILHGDEIKKKISNSLNEYWSTGDALEKRIKRGLATKNSEKYKRAINQIKESGIYKGYNNPDFVKRWKKIYEEDKDVILELIKYSNLPEDFIFKHIFPNKKIKVRRLLLYYEKMGWLTQNPKKIKEFRFLNFENKMKKGHKDGGSIKSIYGQEKYHFMFVYDDFFDQFERIKETLKDDGISDSMIYNNSEKYQIQNFKQVISYFLEMGIVSNVHTKKIRVWKTVSNRTFTVPATKTIFDVNNKPNVILIDKEFNKYDINDDGRPFRVGRFELQINGEKHSLQCIR